MIEINKNNLSSDLSPYLRQHKENPVNWQTWSKAKISRKSLSKNNSK